MSVTIAAMSRSPPDEHAASSLTARASAGDATAREAFVRAHADDVHRAVARILVGHEEAWDDVAQDAMLNVLRALPGFAPGGAASVRTWVLTITARTAVDALRRRSRRAARLALVARGSSVAGDTPEALAAHRQLAARVAEAMRLLPDDQRVALVLRAYHDQDYAEIALATGTTVANVKSRIHRARQALARLIGQGGSHE
jgi:RNA polymerase sigma-70 factor (ECF subfamily)